ncbi:MAG: hypothetical protein ACRDIB_01235 [Ardenticatenaceae bacterium]
MTDQFYTLASWHVREGEEGECIRLREAISKLIALCDEAKPGPYRLVLTSP